MLCGLEILKLLNGKKRTYSEMFRKVKMSHTTLQRVLNAFVEIDVIDKEGNFSITDKGKKLMKHLEIVYQILR